MGALRAILLHLTLTMAFVTGVAAPAPALAQMLGRVVSPIVTIDRDRLFTDSLYGQRVNRELEAASSAMAEETRKIETDLEAEEQALTDQRPTLDPDAFRALADAFDEKVQALRKERDTADANLRKQIEDAQLAFFDKIGPVLGQLVRERGAVMIIDRRAVLLAAADIDITDDAIARIDSVLGDGSEDDTAAPANPGPDATDSGGQEPLDTIPAPQADDGTGATSDTTAPAAE